MITAQTKLNAVIGSPLGHSLGPFFHNEEYAKLGYDAVMLAFENKDLPGLVSAIRNLGISLTAVTLPFKEEILPFLDQIDPLAKRLQSVNTVLQKDGKLIGYNTDYFGISEALDGIDLADKKVLLLGAGGVAKPVAAYVNDQKCSLFCLNRNRDRAQELVQKFGGKVIEESNLANESFDVIINATPIGLSPNENETPLDARWLHADQVVFDIVYNPEETRLLREAKVAGAQTRSGLIMFKAQALGQIRLWETFILNNHS